jgi:hypothetical protein
LSTGTLSYSTLPFYICELLADGFSTIAFTLLNYIKKPRTATKKIVGSVCAIVNTHFWRGVGPDEIPPGRDEKVEKRKASIIIYSHIIERNIALLVICPFGLGRGRRRLHVFRRIPAVEALECSHTLRTILPSTAYITRSPGWLCTSAMDLERLYGIFVTEPLFRNAGVYNGSFPLS